MADNTYISDAEIVRYFLKIAPDFSVFDLAEKHMIDTNRTGEYKTFYFNENTNSITTSFRRAMFRFDKAENNITTSDKKFSYEVVNFKDFAVAICMSTMDESISFNIEKSDRVVGVAF